MDFFSSIFNFDHLLVLFLVLVVFLGLFKHQIQSFLDRLWSSQHVLFRNMVIFITFTILLYFIGQDLSYWSNLVFISDQLTASFLYLDLISIDILFFYFQIVTFNKNKNRRHQNVES